MTTPFSSFAFPASGAPTSRTMPARLAEIKNVKDFGAKGDSSTDDTAAIQAAVDWTAGSNRGTIYFPLGNYPTSSPITFNYDGDLSIHFLGEAGTSVFGNFAGYIFDRHLGTPNNTNGGRVFEKLSITNSHASGGCIRMGSTIGGAIRDCGFNAGHIAITTEDAAGVSSQRILIQNCSFGGGSASGSHYVIIGGGGAIHGCNMPGADTAVRAYGSGLALVSNRAERCGTSFLLGLDSDDNPVGLTGFVMKSLSVEGAWTAFHFAGPCRAFLMSGCGHQGHDLDNAGPIAFVQPSQYGLRIDADCASDGVIQGMNIGNAHAVACYSIAASTSRTNLVVRENSGNVAGGFGVNWIFPANAYTAQFYNNNELSTWTYSELPSGGNVFEGDEFNITDANSTTWGANVTAGGSSGHVLVRWNGSHWTVVGK